MSQSPMWPLSRKILSLAILNVLLMAAVLAAFAQWQFGLSVESLLLGTARDRILAIANAFGRELDQTPFPARGDLLAEYSARYGADFYLLSPRGEPLAGAGVKLPSRVLDLLHGDADPPAPRPSGADQRPRGRGAFSEPPSGNPAIEEGPPPGRRGFRPPGKGPPPERAFIALTRAPLEYWVGVRIPTSGELGERGIPGVLIVRAHSIFNRLLFFDWRALLWLAFALAAAALLCWGPFVHGITRSVRQMDLATEQMAEGRFGQHALEERRDELGHLGTQINRLAQRLEAFVKHQKRFLGDIAHELSAPIARIQFALGILEQKSAETQQPHLVVLRDEIQDMSELVNELLMFSKAGMQPGSAPLKRIELGPLVQRAISHQTPGSGSIQTLIPPAFAVSAHEPYLLRAISNLLRNALRYAGEDGPITVEARQENGRARISVADCGPGLPEESLAEVFEPFYRPESARSRDTGGAGLGLAIVKSCIEACGGSVSCHKREPSGLEVLILLAVAEKAG